MKIKHLSQLATVTYFHDSVLPCVVRIMRSTPGNETIAFHEHEFSELVLVAAGTLKHLHDTNTERLRTGDFLIVHPGTRHGYAELSDDTVVYNLLYTDEMRASVRLFAGNGLLRRVFPSEKQDCPPEVLGTLDAVLIRRVTRLMEEIRAEEKSPAPTSPACCGSLFAAILALLARSHDRHRAKGNLVASPALAKVTGYLREHLGEKVTMTTLRTVSGKSPSTLNRLFLAAYGQSPIDYLIERRLDAAEILRETTSETLAAVAVRCGFADASHLLRTLRRHGRKQTPLKRVPSPASPPSGKRAATARKRRG